MKFSILALVVLAPAANAQIEIRSEQPIHYFGGSQSERGIVQSHPLDLMSDADLASCFVAQQTQIREFTTAAGLYMREGLIAQNYSRLFGRRPLKVKSEFHYVTAYDSAYVGWVERFERINGGMRSGNNFQAWLRGGPTLMVRGGYQGGCEVVTHGEMAQQFLQLLTAWDVPVFVFDHDEQDELVYYRLLLAIFSLTIQERATLGEIHLVADIDGGWGADGEIKSWNSGEEPQVRAGRPAIGMEIEYVPSKNDYPTAEAIAEYLRKFVKY